MLYQKRLGSRYLQMPDTQGEFYAADSKFYVANVAVVMRLEQRSAGTDAIDFIMLR